MQGLPHRGHEVPSAAAGAESLVRNSENQAEISGRTSKGLLLLLLLLGWDLIRTGWGQRLDVLLLFFKFGWLGWFLACCGKSVYKNSILQMMTILLECSELVLLNFSHLLSKALSDD